MKKSFSKQEAVFRRATKYQVPWLYSLRVIYSYQVASYLYEYLYHSSTCPCRNKNYFIYDLSSESKQHSGSCSRTGGGHPSRPKSASCSQEGCRASPCS